MQRLIPLNNQQLYAKAPAVLTLEPAPGTSDRYSFIPTVTVLDALREEGWLPVEASQQRTHKPSRYAAHLVRLQHRDPRPVMGGEYECLLYNGHSGERSLKLLTGVFRYACANGLVLGDTFGTRRIRHVGVTVHDVVEASVEVLRMHELAAEIVEEMERHELDSYHRHAFARAALALRYGTHEEKLWPCTTRTALMPRRVQDVGMSLWQTFNVVQENLSRGGMNEGKRRENGRRFGPVRALKAIDASVDFNHKLFGIAESYLKVEVQ